MPWERYSVVHDSTLRRLQLHVCLSDPLPDYFKPVQCIIEVATIDNHVTQVDEANLPVNSRQYNEPFEGFRCIAQAEEHHREIELPLTCDKRSLLNIFRVQLYLPEPQV